MIYAEEDAVLGSIKGIFHEMFYCCVSNINEMININFIKIVLMLVVRFYERHKTRYLIFHTGINFLPDQPRPRRSTLIPRNR